MDKYLNQHGPHSTYGLLRQIFITGWFFTPEILLTRSNTKTKNEIDWSLLDALKNACSKGVKVYVLLYEEIPQALANNSRRAQVMLEEIPGVKVLRHRSRFDRNVYWSHHEKIVVIDQKIAFVGGIDIALMRYDDSNHVLSDGNNGQNGLWKYNDYQNIRVVDFHAVEKNQTDVIDRKYVPRQPWRDVACQIFGAAATDIGRHFIERWSHARRLSGGTQYYDVLPALELQAPDRAVNQMLKNGGKMASISNLLSPTKPAGKGEKFSSNEFLVNFQKKSSQLEMKLKEESTVYRKGQGKQTSKIVIDALNNIKPAAMSVHPQPLSCVQVLRSVSRWSAGTRHESSIHAAYCNLIEHANDFIYVENQFFASAAVDDDSEMGNRVAAALLSRIVRAIRMKKKFRVVIVMPLFPGFSGEVENETGNAGPLLTVMYWQYRTISKGKDSMIEQIKKVLKETWENNVHNTKNTKDTEDTKDTKDTRKWTDYLQLFGLRTWSIMGSDNDEIIDSSSSSSSYVRIVTENVYVHSKTLVVDDRSVIIGSANINDRSMLGNRDSEMCVVMEDDSHEFGKSMRAASMHEFFANEELLNWMDDRVWKKMSDIASKNTNIYRKVLLPLPDDNIRNWKELKRIRNARTFDTTRYSPDQMKESSNTNDVSEMKEIQGIVVKFPLLFLSDEKISGGTMGNQAAFIFN